MLSSLSRRCLRHLAVVFAVALCTGHAAAQSRTQCPDLTAAQDGPNTVKQTQTAATAFETPIWKTITVGGLKGVNATRAAIEAAPCPIWIGEEADEILGRPAFPFLKTTVELDLVVVSVFELGLATALCPPTLSLLRASRHHFRTFTQGRLRLDLNYARPRLVRRCV